MYRPHVGRVTKSRLPVDKPWIARTLPMGETVLSAGPEGLVVGRYDTWAEAYRAACVAVPFVNMRIHWED